MLVKVVNGRVVPFNDNTVREATETEIATIEASRAQAKNKAEIMQCKRQLMQTDYIAIKFAEGCITEKDYAPIKAQRQAWRDKINELEAE